MVVVLIVSKLSFTNNAGNHLKNCKRNSRKNGNELKLTFYLKSGSLWLGREYDLSDGVLKLELKLDVCKRR